MQEQFDEINVQQFITPKDQLGYAEEYIVVEDENSDDTLLLNYSLSNSLDDIKIAIYARTGLNINLEKAKWKINHDLSINVKHLMNKHKVIFSMTTSYDGKVRLICINMHVGDYWFLTSYAEIKGKYYSWDYYETLEKLKRFLEKYLDDINSNEEG